MSKGEKMLHIVWVYRKKDGYCSPTIVEGMESKQQAELFVKQRMQAGEIRSGKIVSVAEVRDEEGR